jgi:cob(I)alamin adenosyltransferase
MKREKGLVHIYTGNGKGKSTAAFGLALRALGHRMSVACFQFFKEPVSGEIKTLKRFKNFSYEPICPSHPAFATDVSRKKHYRMFLNDWKKFLTLMMQTRADIIVLDEILIAVRDGYLSEKSLLWYLKIWKKKHPGTEIVLTGRGATEALINAADIVTDMCCVKHPYPEVKARKGIEY